MKLPHASSSDPLLFSTTLLLYIVGGLLLIGLVALTIALPSVAIFWKEAASEIIKDYPKASTQSLLPVIMGAIAVGLAIILLALQFIRKLLQIIRTVGEGDPFVSANADRLQAMAWISLTIQIAGIFMGMAILWISDSIKEMEVHYESGNFTSIILILLLFILARVFRRGADMRNELEGTV